MATFYGNENLQADFFQNLYHNFIPKSLTITPWQVKLAKKIFSLTGDPKMKSNSGPQGYNTWIIDQMFKHYQKDSSSTYIKEKTNVSIDVATAFVRNVEEYKGIDVREGLAVKAVDVATGVAEGLEETAGAIPLTVILLATGIAGYLIFAGKKGVRLLP